MSTIANLPLELIAAVLQKLDNVHSLLSSLLTCRAFYSSFQEYPSLIRAEVFRRQLTPALIPYSVAVMEASRIPRPHSDASIQALLATLYDEPEELTAPARFNQIPEPYLLEMIRTQVIIERFVNDYATEAWSLLEKEDPNLPSNVMLSEAEHTRFCRAFYRLELFSTLFPSSINGADSYRKGTNWFMSRYSPWESEQITSIYYFLKEKVIEASVDTIAHDIELGEYMTSYLDFDWDHYTLNRWIAQGVKFISQLISADSFEAKRTLLTRHEHFPHDNAQFLDVIEAFGRRDNIDTSPTLDALTEEQVLASVPPSILDHDHGPFAAWHLIHVPLRIHANIAFNYLETTRHRDRAYVFWSLERLVRHNMLARFGELPQTDVEKHTYTDEEYEEMRESWDIRSWLFLRGIHGYWEKGDENEMAERRRQHDRDARMV
ncbi:hypothetical protein GLAREA_12159 [Glarea lozoyensis ATCC 20868]|uniref:F-box domain-containing protein n=1 Tax=Glarea lozoyensis (strain ATCC 20868 / MF5171) TaxID=1116229 RepID=S3D0L7_GLAL2|nr:uncharacterized protein GLAREA_12159 [Glarea lozoyensis ATCC 20868]EPE32077.1 hypothetical protein GLAREA_12159 [Glarea lozoyensis ATCC 20868]